MISPPRSSVISEGDKREEEKRPSAAGCGSPPPPSGTETTEASLPSPEEHAAFVRGLAGLPRGSWQVRLALANDRVTEAELTALTTQVPLASHGPNIPQTQHVAPSPATPPEAGSPDPDVACAPTLVLSTSMPSTSPQVAPPTDAATQPTAAAPDRPPSVVADAADPGEARRPTAPVGDPDPGRRTDSADARSSGADGVARRPSARRADQVRHSGDPPIAMMSADDRPDVGPPRRVEGVWLRAL